MAVGGGGITGTFPDGSWFEFDLTADEIADKLLERFYIKLLEPAQRETVQQAAEHGFRECKP